MASIMALKIEKFCASKFELESTLTTFLLLLTEKTSEVAALMQPTIARVQKKLNKYTVCNEKNIDKALATIKKLNTEITTQIIRIRPIYYVITSKDFKTGLRGVPLLTCNSSFVDPKSGVFYGNEHISALQNLSVEEVLFLLQHGKSGNNVEIADYTIKLQETASQPIEPLLLVSNEDPMDMLATTLLLLKKRTFITFEEEALFFKAHMPFIIASVINAHAGWGETPPYDANKSLVENFVMMLQVPEKSRMSSKQLKKLTDFFRLFLILHFDHGGGNLSTVVARFIASGKPPLANTLAVAATALNTPLHGGANKSAFEVVQEAAQYTDISAFIEKFIDKNKILPGFGHAVLEYDPRWEILADYCKQHFQDNHLVQTALTICEVAPNILEEKKPNMRNKTPNVDQISQTGLQAAGFNHPEYSTLLFFLSRSYGIITQITEERQKNRPLFRPDSISENHTIQITPPLSLEHLQVAQSLLEQLVRNVNAGDLSCIEKKFRSLTQILIDTAELIEREQGEKKFFLQNLHTSIEIKQIELGKVINSALMDASS
ncbi:MAG: citrate/2-methylcitrate synthase [Chlamydiota bacterium]